MDKRQLLRYAFGIVFIWFGVLKLFNVSPVTPLISTVSPIMFPLLLPSIAVFEIVLGIGFFVKQSTKVSSLVMIVYLAILTALVLYHKGFSPWFPLLTYDGEFVVKNLVFIAAGVLLLEREKNNETH